MPRSRLFLILCASLLLGACAESTGPAQEAANSSRDSTAVTTAKVDPPAGPHLDIVQDFAISW